MSIGHPAGTLPGPAARLVPAATVLVWAVRCRDELEIAAALRQATTIAGGGGRGLRALALLLAAMVPDDEPPSQLLGWQDDPAGYLRLREHGLSRVDAIDALGQDGGADVVAGDRVGLEQGAHAQA